MEDGPESKNELPLFRHRMHEESAFTPEALVEAVQRQRNLPHTGVPAICVLDFDGDLTDWLVESGKAIPHPTWACFHTAMYAFHVDGLMCGLVARTIGGPYAVLVAEQLAVSGAQVLLGLTSAGRIDPHLPVPSLVVATEAIRDEGTSYHYLSPAETVSANSDVAKLLVPGLQTVGLPVVTGRLWTTDAPYRETLQDIADNAARGALAVEMQAASLFAFAHARGVQVGVVAHLTNAVEHDSAGTEQFDKGSNEQAWLIVQAMCRSARGCLTSTG